MQSTPPAGPEVKDAEVDAQVEAEGESDVIMSDDPMVIKLTAECAEMNGDEWKPELGMTQLLNPATVINIEKDLIKLRAELEEATDPQKRQELEKEINKKESKQRIEMRGVMKDWLKALFVIQSVLSIVVFGFIAYDAVPGFPQLDLVWQVLGYWGFWLFTIPSLRSRKPGGMWGMGEQEKRALDTSFLLTPLVNVGVPFVSRSIPTLFWANVATLAGCYIFGFLAPATDGNNDASLPGPIKFALQAIDYGSGQERGLRGESRDRLFERMREEKQQEQENKE